MMDLLPGIHPSIVNVDVSTVRIEPEATDTTQRPSYENISLRKKPKSEPSSPACRLLHALYERFDVIHKDSTVETVN